MIDQDSYPVIITETRKYLVWVPADSAQDAYEQVRDGEPWRWADGEIPFDGGYEAERPDEWMWWDVLDNSPQQDAHVVTHRLVTGRPS